MREAGAPEECHGRKPEFVVSCSMKHKSQFFFFGFLLVAVATVFCLPTLWPQLTGKAKDYDLGGLTVFVSLLVCANLGLLIATLWARRKEAAAQAMAGQPGTKLAAEAAEPNASVRLDFTRTFPHVFWVSSVSYDSESPDGFRYKMFAVRREPEMIIELLLLRETVNGPKREVFRMQASMDKFDGVYPVIQEIERDKNVSFEEFDLAGIRTFDQFRARAIEIGWEEFHVE